MELGMMVCAVRLYAPLCINASTLVIFAAAIASGRSPSKDTINTREMGGVGVDVIVGETVPLTGEGVLLGVRVAVGGGAIVGGGGEANDPHDCRKIKRGIKSRLRRIGFRMFLQYLFANFIGVSFYSSFAEGFINGDAIPIWLQRQTQGIGGSGGCIHDLERGGYFNWLNARPGCDPWNAIIFDDESDMILFVAAMIGCDDDERAAAQVIFIERSQYFTSAASP